MIVELPTMYEYKATLVRVVDGDTLSLDIDLGFGIAYRLRGRLYGVDTPEVYGVKKGSEEYQRGKAASAFTQDWCDKHESLVIVSHDGKKLSKGKYGRWIVEVYGADERDGESLNRALIREGHSPDMPMK